MPDRKKTPSVLDELLGGASAQEPESKPSVPTEGQKARSTEVQRARRPASRKSASTEVQKEANTEVQKIKTTFLFSRQAISRLEACWYEMRCSSGRKDISRSQIIEQALEQALEEYDQLKERSKLAQYWLSQGEK